MADPCLRVHRALRHGPQEARLIRQSDRVLAFAADSEVSARGADRLGERRVGTTVDDSERLSHSVLDTEAGPRLLRTELEELEAEHTIERATRVEEPSLAHAAAGYRSAAMSAGLDGLSNEQRELLVLLLQRRLSYREAGRQLGLSEARARALAEDALVALAPVTSRAVDPEWRSDVVDYLLAQQDDVDAEATRGHLRRAEAARAWAASVLDALAPLLGEEVPEVPGVTGRLSGAGTQPTPVARSERRAAARSPAARRSAPPPSAASAPQPVCADAGKPRARADAVRPAGDGLRRLGAGIARLRASAGAALRRARRSPRVLYAVSAALLAALALAVAVWPIGLLRGGGSERPRDEAARQAVGSDQSARPVMLGNALLTSPVGREAGDLHRARNRLPAGIVILLRVRDSLLLVIRAAGLPPSTRRDAYEVWLYNHRRDMRSLGRVLTDAQGNLFAVARLPRDAGRFRFVDISREALDRNPAHSGRSILRAPLPRPRSAR